MFTKSFKNQRKNIIFDPKTPWKSSQNGTKTTPRGDFLLLNLHIFFDRFLLRFGYQNASLWAPFLLPKSLQKIIKNHLPQKSPQDHTISPQDGPRSPQEAPRGSKRPPRASKETPKKLKKHPKRLQKHPQKLRRMPGKPKRNRIRPQ